MTTSTDKRIVLLTGGTGFVGQYVTKALLNAGCRIRRLLRRADSVDHLDQIEEFEGDILDRASVAEAARGCDSIVHLVGIIREQSRKGITFDRIHIDGTRNMVDAAHDAGIKSFIHMSANGADKNGETGYQKSKWQAEEIVRTAEFDQWTIFRPSVIFGQPGPGTPEFSSQLIESLIKALPVWPVFGKGDYRLQPVAVENVAEAFVRALQDVRFSGKTYCLAGPQSYSYVEVLDILAAAINMKPRRKVFQPIWLMRPVISALAPTGMLPITPEQFEMLLAGNTCDSHAFRDDFEIDLVPFETKTLAYLKS